MAQVKEYTRRTKKGKIITVRSHSRAGGGKSGGKSGSGSKKPSTFAKRRAFIDTKGSGGFERSSYQGQGINKMKKGGFGKIRSSKNVGARELLYQYPKSTKKTKQLMRTNLVRAELRG